ncbi:MAG: glycosyltransferase family 4 protein [Desulfobacteraceae bacterium]|nr:glycosyltransferase family 4 protein [Desulfobacteraceae bacterium]
MIKRIGFFSTRLAGTDGVSLEAAKWAQVLEEDGHSCYWFAGEVEHHKLRSYLAPEAHFKHGQIAFISDKVFGKTRRNPDITERIHQLRATLKKKLHHFIQRFDIELLIVENAMTIPMNIPLGLALAETISETQVPVIAHHHDFFWERKRFAVNAVGEFLPMAFPADLPSIRHVVINSLAQRDLAHRRGIVSTLIPNVLDFDHPPEVDTGEIQRFRESIGLSPDDLMVLQPTRIIERKGIEHAIELVRALENPRCKLVISHENGDEGMGYGEWIQSRARDQAVDLRVVNKDIISPWSPKAASNGHFSLWTAYAAADLVTFCSLYEGFGNGLIEAVYFKKPVVVNRYETFINDIEPLGFDFVSMDGYLTRDVVESVRHIFSGNPHYTPDTENNFNIARRHFSYQVLRRRLRAIMADCIDAPFPQSHLHESGSMPRPVEEIPMKIAV